MDSSSKILRTAKTVFKFQWVSHKIDDFVSTLDRLRGSMSLAALLALRKSSEASIREVLSHLLEIRESQVQNLNTAKAQEMIEVISINIQNNTDEALRTIQDMNSACLHEITALRHDIAQSGRPIGREEEILEWLDFRQTLWRYHEVDTAYESTYEWILQPPSKQNQWSDFEAHLQNNNAEPYFINGKAGSGKSTLMRFVQTHGKTRRLREKWAGSKKLAMSHFYFWNLGTTPLQKTHTGLLRSLLHDILRQYSELIPAVFPKIYCNSTKLDEDHPPEYIELKEAFGIMVKKSSFMKIAIFIDSIDEYEEDHRDMALFLRSLSSGDLKVVVSSRPLNACLGALEGCPS